MLVSKPNKLVAVAMANKAARIAWVTEGFATADLKDAQSLLDQLS